MVLQQKGQEEILKMKDYSMRTEVGKENLRTAEGSSFVNIVKGTEDVKDFVGQNLCKSKLSVFRTASSQLNDGNLNEFSLVSTLQSANSFTFVPAEKKFTHSYLIVVVVVSCH